MTNSKVNCKTYFEQHCYSLFQSPYSFFRIHKKRLYTCLLAFELYFFIWRCSRWGCLFTELGFRVRFRVGFSSWIFELGFFGRDLFGGVSNKCSVVLHNILCQRCCTSSWGLFKSGWIGERIGEFRKYFCPDFGFKASFKRISGSCNCSRLRIHLFFRPGFWTLFIIKTFLPGVRILGEIWTADLVYKSWRIGGFA